MNSFLDYAEIQITSGNGGNGLASFRREKYIPFGGPDGGNGGNGGSIIFVGNKNINSLRDFRNKRIFKAINGGNGGSNKKNGRNGDDLKIYVPLGTEIYDIENNIKIADITIEGKGVRILEGGKGGLGNTFFKSSTNRAPTKAKDGKKGDKLKIALDLKTISDLSLVGFPNVGKSSIITKITNSKAEVGDYAFTTLNPNIGVLKGDIEDYLIADIPGLIEGSSSGKGLGHKFLKHIERSKFLIEVLDLSCKNLDELKSQHSILIKELNSYNKDLPLRIKLVVLNKLDLCSFKDDIVGFDPIKNCGKISISCHNNSGIESLREMIEDFKL
ncbi:GTPase ObgE [bacterium]|jgi:GTP-binding protein|nr:GTPase ObgE [bacterium]MBT3795524.1 GTPase ObgE [bacterium]MBT4634705.1 GTPase ObgE [bacterium]